MLFDNSVSKVPVRHMAFNITVYFFVTTSFKRNDELLHTVLNVYMFRHAAYIWPKRVVAITYCGLFCSLASGLW